MRTLHAKRNSEGSTGRAGATVPAGGLWTFSVRLYARPGVAEACVALQETSGVNVPVLLLGAWLGTQSKTLDADTVAGICADIAPWHEEVVAPLRGLRRLLKTTPPLGPSPSAEGLRERIKACELEAEKIEIARLEALASALAFAAADADAVHRNLANIVAHHRREAPDKAALRDIAIIAAAASAG